jgi:hypothetical protein
MDAAHSGCDHESQDSQQQAHGESQQGQQKSYEQDPRRDQVPVGSPRLVAGGHCA